MFQSSFASKIIVFSNEVLKLLIIKRRKHMLLAVTKHGLFILLREHRDNALEQNLSMLAVTKHGKPNILFREHRENALDQILSRGSFQRVRFQKIPAHLRNPLMLWLCVVQLHLWPQTIVDIFDIFHQAFTCQHLVKHGSSTPQVTLNKAFKT